jgi:hypothetical protein
MLYQIMGRNTIDRGIGEKPRDRGQERSWIDREDLHVRAMRPQTQDELEIAHGGRNQERRPAVYDREDPHRPTPRKPLMMAAILCPALPSP